MNSETRNCQNCKKDFTIEPDDFSFYEKMKVPAPTFCPDCRRMQRFAWRNFLNLHKSVSGLSGESVITNYDPRSGVIVYKSKEWHSDKWSGYEYGQEYDFSRPFFEQYHGLLKAVPKPALDTDDGLMSTNCEYTNDFAMGKDCYLVAKAWKLENVMYSFYVVSSRDLVDAHTSFGKDEGNYETVNTEHCYRCRYIYDCQSCIESAFCFDCRSCTNCFMCTGLRSKSYYFKNQDVGKERYKEIMEEYKLHTYSGVERAKEEFEPLMKSHPRKALRMINCNNCLGDLLLNCHNVKNSFLMLSSENCRFDNYADGAKDSYDTDAGGGSELAYQCDLPAFSSNIVGSFSAWNCQDSSYISQMYRSRNCFGCNGLKDAEYCILNKQYTKEEYFSMIGKIKQQMIDMPYIDKKGNKYFYGDYLPAELSFFSYDESEANQVYPLSVSEIESQGLQYREKEETISSEATINAIDLPDSIDDVSDFILNEIIKSKSSDSKYKITSQELQFYRKYRIPLPRESFIERHTKRHKIAGSFKLYQRKSDKSGSNIVSSYPPDAPETVWSNEEYKVEFE